MMNIIIIFFQLSVEFRMCFELQGTADTVTQTFQHDTREKNNSISIAALFTMSKSDMPNRSLYENLFSLL